MLATAAASVEPTCRAVPRLPCPVAGTWWRGPRCTWTAWSASSPRGVRRGVGCVCCGLDEGAQGRALERQPENGVWAARQAAPVPPQRHAPPTSKPTLCCTTPVLKVGKHEDAIFARRMRMLNRQKVGSGRMGWCCAGSPLAWLRRHGDRGRPLLHKLRCATTHPFVLSLPEEHPHLSFFASPLPNLPTSLLAANPPPRRSGARRTSSAT